MTDGFDARGKRQPNRDVLGVSRRSDAPPLLRVLIAAGGTGGHVYPALAVADVLRRRGHDVRFSGGHRLEATLVPEAGYPLHRLPARGLPRRPSVEAVRAGVDLVRGIVGAGRLVRRHRIDVVFGLGGYDSLAPSLAAGWRGVPVVLHEQNAHLSLAHRLSVRRAATLALALPLRDGSPARAGLRIEVTGNPLRPQVRSLAEASPDERTASRRRALDRFGLGDDRVTVLVVGGSLGARAVNEGVLDVARSWSERNDVQVLHIAGRDHEEAMRRAWDGLETPAVVVGYVDDYDAALACADLVVARSGGSVSDLTACGLPSVLVPLPGAPGGHQEANARTLADADAAVAVPQQPGTDFAARLAVAVTTLLDDPTRRRSMAEAARSLGRTDGADRVAALIEEAASR